MEGPPAVPLGPSHAPVLTKRGLVCSASPLAGAIGAQVLREGGNAFDAAIAVAAAEAVTIPPMCGLGGEVFAMLYEASTGKMYGLAGSGRAPMRASRDHFVGLGYDKMPTSGPLSPAVPGEVHAWGAILERFGTRALGKLIAPAADLAEEGFPLPAVIGSDFARLVGNGGVLRDYPSSAKAYLRPDGRPYEAGDVLVQKDLARSIRRVAEGGVEEFYAGGLARDIAAAFAAAGGLIDAADLAAQATHVTDDPPSVEYHGHRVYATPLPSHGVLTLELLSLLDGFDLAAMGHNTAESIHVMAEAKRLAYADRLAYVADPAFVQVPIDELLSKEHATRRRALIDASRAADAVGAGELAHAGAPSAHTSYFSIVDRAGNAVSYIHSNSAVFGSGFVAEGTGILFNNRVGRGFSLDAGHVNVLEPGKRSVNTIHSYLVAKDGALRFVGGTPGGDSQPQWNAQVLSRVIDHGLNVQEAADAPRWVHFPGTDPASIDRGMELRLEDGFGDGVGSGLGARGHNVAPYTTEMMVGAVQLIAIDPETGVRAGGTDRRCDGYPIPE